MASAAPCLQWKNDVDSTEVFHLEADEVFVGRREDAGLVFRHPEVSRRHARIYKDAEGLTVIDLESTHGTWVNGSRVTRHVLRSGDRIRFGLTGPEVTLNTGAADSLNAMSRAVEHFTISPGGGAPQSAIAKLSNLLELQYSFGQNFSAVDVFRHILKSVLDLSGAQRGFILRHRRDALDYTVGLDSAGAELGRSDFRASTSVIRRVTESGAPVFMTEGIHNELAAQASIVAQNLRAVACLPLRAMVRDSGQTETVGILYIDSQTRMHALTGLDQKILTKLAEEAGRAIENLLMVEGLAERKKLDHDLALAHEAQRNLLPRELPEFPPFDIDAFSRPTRHVGGDFYDFFPAGKSLCGVLADISGKGVAAALTASMIQGAIGAEFRSAVAADRALTFVNTLVWQKTPSNRFATLFLFTLSPDGSGLYVGAGHNPAYLYRAATGAIEELESQGVPFGMFREALYEAVAFQMHSGDVLVVYSDGLTEAENIAGDMFGEDRVKEIVEREAPHGSSELGQAILREVEVFTRDAIQNDDLTFVVIHRAA